MVQNGRPRSLRRGRLFKDYRTPQREKFHCRRQNAYPAEIERYLELIRKSDKPWSAAHPGSGSAKFVSRLLCRKRASGSKRARSSIFAADSRRLQSAPACRNRRRFPRVHRQKIQRYILQRDVADRFSMIYQHRIVIARGGKPRNARRIPGTTMNALDEAGSVLIGDGKSISGTKRGAPCAIAPVRQHGGLGNPSRSHSGGQSASEARKRNL
ncbi:MAG: hypothetical protein CM15mP75_0010 [Flammeovirgaceae bacterium]|nr:MAG: hypothetical protein CM15mP75_0010 [Flammeovirgaceae bacterium]